MAHNALNDGDFDAKAYAREFVDGWADVPCGGGFGSCGSNTKRVWKELRKVQNIGESGIEALTPMPNKDSGPPPNPTKWSVCGPRFTPYVGGTFEVEVTLSADHPFESPRVRFLTPIYHPVVSQNGGDVIIKNLRGAWKPCFTLEDILEMIRAAFAQGVPDSDNTQPAANTEAAKLWWTDREKFVSVAREVTISAAGARSDGKDPLFPRALQPAEQRERISRIWVKGMHHGRLPQLSVENCDTQAKIKELMRHMIDIRDIQLTWDGVILPFNHWNISEYGLDDGATLSFFLSDPSSVVDRLPDVARTIRMEFGHDLSSEMIRLAPPISTADAIYRKAFAEVKAVDEEHLQKLLTLPGTLSSNIRRDQESSVETLHDLFEDAAEAQRRLKELVAPHSTWAETVMDASFIELHGEEAAKKQRVFQRAMHSRTNEGMPADEFYDPGVKSRERVEQKVRIKYDGNFCKIRDLSRLAAQFKTCEGLLNGIAWLKEKLDVVEIENRFANPTPLGWRDVTIIAAVKLGPLRANRSHLVEVQLQLLAYKGGKLRAHDCYKKVRALLPEVCKVPAEDMGKVQGRMLDLLTSSDATSVNALSSNSSESDDVVTCPLAFFTLPYGGAVAILPDETDKLSDEEVLSQVASCLDFWRKHGYTSAWLHIPIGIVHEDQFYDAVETCLADVDNVNDEIEQHKRAMRVDFDQFGFCVHHTNEITSTAILKKVLDPS